MKLDKPILLMATAILLVTACVVIVSADWLITTNANVTINSPINLTYTSQSNTTLGFSFLYQANATHANCTLYNTTNWFNFASNDATLNNTNTTLYSTLAFTSGETYYWMINCTNSTNATYVSSPNYTFTADYTVPIVNLNTTSGLQNNTWTSGSINISVVVNDTTSGPKEGSAYYNLYNASNGTSVYDDWVQMTNETTLTANSKEYFSLATLLNTASHTTGTYYLMFKANDSITAGYGADNQDATANYTVKFDNVAPTRTINTPANGWSVNGLIHLSTNITDAGSGVNNGTVYYTIYNATDGVSHVNWTKMVNTSASIFNETGNATMPLNTTTYMQGTYYIAFRVNDTIGAGSNNENITVNTSFIVDRTVPVVTNNTRPAIWHRGTIQLNISVSDTLTSVNADKVYYSIVNSSGNVTTLLTALSNVSSGNVAYFNKSFDTTTLDDGEYNISFFANDTIMVGYDNMNVTNFTLRIDNTAPTITHTCNGQLDSFSTYKDGGVSCTCSVADPTPGSGANAATYDTGAGLTATVGSGSTTCTVTDIAGNSNSHTITYSVRGTSSSTGAAPGGGVTGAPAATSASSSTSTITSIAADTPAKVTVAKAEISVTEVAITPTQTVANVVVTTESLAAKPAATTAPTGEVYQYLKIEATNVANKIKTGEITFKVPVSWITGSNIDKTKVVLNRYADNKWNALATTLVSEGAAEITYKATTPGFSYFAVTGEEKPAAAAPAEEGTPAAGEGAAEGETAAPAAKAGGGVWYWVIAIVIIAAAVGYYYYSKSKKKK